MNTNLEIIIKRTSDSGEKLNLLYRTKEPLTIIQALKKIFGELHEKITATTNTPDA